MRLDKLAYLGFSFFTGLVIIIVIVLGTYGTNISNDPNFLSFFKWYIFLLVVNLLNILITLVFHYLMADIPGVKGIGVKTLIKEFPLLVEDREFNTKDLLDMAKSRSTRISKMIQISRAN